LNAEVQDRIKTPLIVPHGANDTAGDPGFIAGWRRPARRTGDALEGAAG